MENNKSFCAVPFVSIMVNTDTTVRYCCMVKGSVNKIKKDNGAFYTCKDRRIMDYDVEEIEWLREVNKL